MPWRAGGFVQPKKSYSKPTVRTLNLEEPFNPSAGLSYEQWLALKGLRDEHSSKDRSLRRRA
jgi:hypothetical protein